MFQAGTRLSLIYQVAPGIFTFYFPVALGFALVRWWGLRILPALYLNAVISAAFWGLNKTPFLPLFALVETLEVGISYLLVKEYFKKPWSPTPNNLILYTVRGVLIPSVLAFAANELLLYFNGITPKDLILWEGITSLVGDMMGGVAITIPLIIVLTPILEKYQLSRFPVENFDLRWTWKIPFTEKVLLAMGFGLALTLSATLPLPRTWYFMGLFVLLPAIWYGLEFSLIVNAFICFLTLGLPSIMGRSLPATLESVQMVATLITLCFSALVAGSAVSDDRKRLLKIIETEQALKIAKEQAEEASRAKSDFLARMSHEIRTPLNSVLGMLELLKETTLSKDQERYLSLFSHAGENLKALISDLLDFSKIEAKALNVETISYDLHSTVRSVFEILQIKAEEKGLKFELNIDGDVPRYQVGDPTRLRQVLFNLLGNALKFTDEGEVLVNVKLQKNTGELLLIEITDTGIGIPREKQYQLFMPFVQGETSITRKYGGTGLGLVISKNLVEIMGGKIEMQSLAGRGTTFRILLPHRPDFIGPQQDVNTPKNYWPDTFGDRRFRLLLVDDSEDNRVLITHYLKNLPFDFVEAVNGKEAVEKFKKEHFDVIFMDMQMPVMSGYKATELIRHIEQEEKKPRTCIIALTATAVLEDLRRTLDSGCDRYMVKPVKKSEVLQTLAQALTTKTPDSRAFKEPPSPSI